MKRIMAVAVVIGLLSAAGCSIGSIQRDIGGPEKLQSGFTVNGYKIKPGADLSGADLSGADLGGRELCGTDLAGADLTGANLSGAIL